MRVGPAPTRMQIAHRPATPKGDYRGMSQRGRRFAARGMALRAAPFGISLKTLVRGHMVHRFGGCQVHMVHLSSALSTGR